MWQLLLLAMLTTCSGVAAGSRVGSAARAERRLQADGDVHPWSTLLANSFLFYEAQQSGVLPAYNRVKRGLQGGWRDNAHTSDGADIGVDLSGGFYDAGDHVKYHLPMTAAMTSIGIGALVHEQGYRAAGEWDTVARTLKWGADYLVKCHTVASDTPTANVVAVQVGDTGTDHGYWGRPEQQTGFRPAKTTKTTAQGASDIMSGAAAVFAATAMVLSKAGVWQNTVYAAALIKRARQLLAAADAMPGRWSDAAYASSDYKDEVAMGYMLLCWYDLGAKPATLPASCNTAMARYAAALATHGYDYNYDWDSNIHGSSAVMQLLAPQLKAANGGGVPACVAQAASFMARQLAVWQDTSKKCPSNALGDGWWQVCYTPGGMAYLTKWGTLRHALNIAFAASLQANAAAAAGDRATARKHRCWARSQLMYAAGSNPAKQSYIVGYTPAGGKPADRPHHRSSSCSPDFGVSCTYTQLGAVGPNPNVLKGALVGGPNNLDQFNNDRSDYVTNEVALDYNMGFTGALASTTLTTARLTAAKCSWATYCSGGCDAAAEDASLPLPSPTPVPSPVPRSPVPSPSPSRSPSPTSSPRPSPGPSPMPSPRGPSPSPTPVGTCAASVNPSKKYACDACAATGASSPIMAVCLACPALTAPSNQEWVCAQCAAPAYIKSAADASVCVTCAVKSGNAGLCTQCLTAAAKLSTALKVDASTQMRSCLTCMTATADAWACSQCLALGTLAQVDACVSCVATKAKPASTCISAAAAAARSG